MNDPDLRMRFDEYRMGTQFQTDPELAPVLGAELRLRGGLRAEADIRAE